MSRDCSSMVERNLAMVEVVGSIPVSRSWFFFILLLNFCNNKHLTYKKHSIQLSYFQKIKIRLYRFIKRKSYTHQIYQLIYTFLRNHRIINRYPPMPKSIGKDLVAAKELVTNVNLLL